ncbi:MAG: 6-bladed beta-propeller [Balneolaceae bacterium]|nr:6-bladed beta-propeller [Balneolaceae bacterium]
MKKIIASIAILVLIVTVSIIAGYYFTETAMDAISAEETANITFVGYFPDENDHVTIGNVLKILSTERYLFLLDQMRSTIHKFDLNGNYIKSIGQPGPGPGELQMPLSMAVKENDIYVFEQSKMQIQIFNEEGVYSDVILFEGSYEEITLSETNIWLTNHYFSGMPSFSDMPGDEHQSVYTIYNHNSGDINHAGLYPPVMDGKDKIGTILTSEYDGKIYSLNRKLFYINIYDSESKELIKTLDLKGGEIDNAIAAVQIDYDSPTVSLMDMIVNNNGIYIPIQGSDLTIYKFNFDGKLDSSTSFSNFYNDIHNDRYIRKIHVKELSELNVIRYYLKLYSDFPRVLIFDENLAS